MIVYGSFLDIFASSSGLNHGRFSDAEYDKLLGDAAETPDKSARNAKLAEAEARLLGEAAMIPIYFYSRVYLISPRVLGWEANALDFHNFLGVKFAPQEK